MATITTPPPPLLPSNNSSSSLWMMAPPPSSMVNLSEDEEASSQRTTMWHMAERARSAASRDDPQSYQQALELYQHIRSQVTRRMPLTTLTSSQCCLDARIVTTLHACASAQLQQRQLPHTLQAVACHEHVLEFLTDLHRSLDQEHEYIYEELIFVPLNHQQHAALLLQSLQALAVLYQAVQVHPSGLAQFEAALELVEDVQQKADLALSLVHVYTARQEYDAALPHLEQALQVLSQDKLEPVLLEMHSLGMAYEECANFDQAMHCYEQVLLTRSRTAADSMEVAQSLIHVGRVMELQGNLEGSMDLYKAAQAIYKKQLKSETVEAKDVQSLMALVPKAMEQERYEDVVAYLSKCIQFDNDVDKTFLYYNLGVAYVHLQDYVSATICLLEATKHDGVIGEEQVFGLLQRVEFLQRESHKRRPRAVSFDDDGDSSESSSSRNKGRRRHRSHSSGDGGTTTENANEFSTDVADDEGTTYYDTESGVSRDNCLWPRSDLSSSFIESDQLDLDSPTIAIDPVPQERELEGYQITIPELTNSDEAGVRDGPPTVCLARIEESSTSHKDTGGDSGGVRMSSSGHSVHTTDTPSESSRRIRFKRSTNGTKPSKRSIAKTLTGKFRRQRKSGFRTLTEESAETPVSEEDKTPESSTLPSEEEYHAAIEGPVQFVHVRSNSWETSVSQITLKFDDPSGAREGGQEWWWGVTTEGFGRWLPSVIKAVEAADNFLSAKSIHSKKKPSPAQYVSDDESISGKESIEVTDHPSHLGIADSKTIGPLGGDVLARAKLVEANEAKERGPQKDGALSVYSGYQHRHSTKVDAEIEKYSALVNHQRETRNPELSTSLFTLAVLYSRNRAPDRAMELAAEALRLQKSRGEVEDAARSLHFLADLYLHQKQFSTSLTFYTEALRLESKHFGESSDEVATTLNCIGTVYSLQDEFEKAMESHEKALHILKRRHGDELKNPLVIESLCQIGAVYYRERNSFARKQSHTEGDYTTFIEAGMLETIGRAHEDRGSYKLAISFFEERLQFLQSRPESEMSEDDIDEVATTLNSLGMLSSRAGLYLEAINYYEQAVKFQLRLGCDDVQLASARVLTGAVHFQLGEWEKALMLHIEALAVLKSELGQENETVAATLYQIGSTRLAMFDLENATSVLKQAFNIQLHLLGDDHPATLRTRREIANLFAILNPLSDKAIERFDEILAEQRNIHGDRHPNIAETLHSIGRTYVGRGDDTSALQILEECYYMRTEFLGWDHPHQASTLFEISKIHLRRNKIKKASHICNVVLTIRQESLTEDHIDVALALATKASCQVAEGKLESATKNFSTALRMAEAAVGLTHPHIADIQLQIAGMYTRDCKFELARSALESAMSIYRGAKLPEEYPGLREAEEKMERLERDELLCV